MTIPVGAVPGVTGTTPTAATTGASKASSASSASAPTSSTTLDPQAFLKLLVAQLQYQDPSQPADMSSFLSQTATMNQMESMQQLTAATNALLRNSQAQTATSLVGQHVAYTGSDGAAHTGVVTGASLATPAITLTVGTDQVALSDITSVSTAG